MRERDAMGCVPVGAVGMLARGTSDFFAPTRMVASKLRFRKKAEEQRICHGGQIRERFPGQASPSHLLPSIPIAPVAKHPHRTISTYSRAHYSLKPRRTHE